MAWVVVEACDAKHTLREDGWRPLGPGQHAHWLVDDFPFESPEEEDAPEGYDGSWLPMSRDNVASLGVWMTKQGEHLAAWADDEEVSDASLIYAAMELMGTLAEMAEINGPNLARVLLYFAERDNLGQ